MSSKIISFVTERIIMSGSVSNKDLLDAYFQHSNSTSGRNSLYNHISQLEGVSRTKTHFNGISLHSITQIVVEPIKVEPIKVNTPSAYELRCLELKERKLDQQKSLEAQQKELKERELAQQKELKELDLAQQNKLKEMELDQQRDLHEMDLTHAIEMKTIDVREKDKDREFMREENNKNRRMHMTTRHNKYLDFAVYGNPSNQYIECSSMVDVLGFQAFNVSNNYDRDVLDSIESESLSASKSVRVYENTTVKDVECIEVSEAKKVLRKISKTISSPDMLDLIVNLDKISSTAVSDECRTIPSRYVSKHSIQNARTNSTSGNKQSYAKSVNKMRVDVCRCTNKLDKCDCGYANRMLINCACCNLELDLNSSGCHRAHDIPQSVGGDWSLGNIYLTCASCNATMGNGMSVLEYKVDLYVKVLGSN